MNCEKCGSFIFEKSIREEIDDLKRDYANGTLVAGVCGRLLGIIDRLEKRQPTFVTVPSNPGLGVSVPYISPVIPAQKWPPYLPYVGDPPTFPYGGTICDATGGKTTVINGGRNVVGANTSSPDATGDSNPGPGSIIPVDDIPF